MNMSPERVEQRKRIVKSRQQTFGYDSLPFEVLKLGALENRRWQIWKVASTYEKNPPQIVAW